MTDPQGASPAAPRSTRARRAVAFCAALLCVGFIALGSWQVQRLQWKNALVAQVDQRVHAVPVAAPAPSSWAALSKEHDEYRHLRLDGRFVDELATKVQAATELGAGYWVLTPFRGDDGAVVIVNRGFIPAGATAAGAGPGATSITGLLRMSEHGRGFLRENDVANNRWYARDVEAIGAARGLARVAPYFIDQDAAPAVSQKTGSDPFVLQQGEGFTSRKNGSDPISKVPVGGLTVISFHNNHLVYALTWFAMALMAAGACFAIGRGKI
jgi:surfeit locus 1 family protein